MGGTRVLLTFAAIAMLSGCATDLRTTEISKRNNAADPLQAGFVYNLPAASVNPTASVRVADCPVDEDAQKALDTVSGQTLPVPTKGAVFAVTGDIAVEQVAGKQVLIDYRELGDFLKTSSISLERHPNLMLKSVNVTVEDESPTLIANLTTIAADIALFGVSPPTAIGAGAAFAAAVNNPPAHPMDVGPADTVQYLACKPETLKLLQARKVARDAKDKDTQSLEETNAALAKLIRNAETGFTPAEITTIHGYRDRILELTASIAAASETIAGADAKLSLKLEIVDTATPADTVKTTGLPIQDIIDGSVYLSASDPRLRAFIERHFVTATGQVQGGLGKLFASRECTAAPAPTCISSETVLPVLRELSVVKLGAKELILRVDGDTPSFANAPEGQKKRAGSLHASQGILYVEPARYTFTLTRKAFPADILEPLVTLKAVTASVPQKGTYLSLPVHAGFGEKVELKATFNTDGSLATGGYGRPSSAGKAISSSLAGFADKVIATQAAIEARKLALLKAEADRLTAQKAILDAQDKLHPRADPLADLNAQIAVVNANATLAEANVRLMVANAKLGAGP